MTHLFINILGDDFLNNQTPQLLILQLYAAKQDLSLP
jgi:hypothetical protein